MQITLTLEELSKFLKKLKPNTVVKDKSLDDIQEILQNTFRTKIFNSHDETYRISSKEELVNLIQTKGTPPKGKDYNEEYLEHKFKKGEYRPHKYENYTFWLSDIGRPQGKVEMKANSQANNKGFDYMSLHENQRSVLKTTFLFSWQKIVKKIIERYAKEAKK